MRSPRMHFGRGVGISIASLLLSTGLSSCVPSNAIEISIHLRDPAQALRGIRSAFTQTNFAEIAERITGVEAVTGKAPASPATPLQGFQSLTRPQVRCSYAG